MGPPALASIRLKYPLERWHVTTGDDRLAEQLRLRSTASTARHGPYGKSKTPRYETVTQAGSTITDLQAASASPARQTDGFINAATRRALSRQLVVVDSVRPLDMPRDGPTCLAPFMPPWDRPSQLRSRPVHGTPGRAWHWHRPSLYRRALQLLTVNAMGIAGDLPRPSGRQNALSPPLSGMKDSDVTRVCEAISPRARGA